MSQKHRLEISTPSDREILMTRIFDAPRHLVFEALTTPELLKRWMFGPDSWSLAVCEIDLRVGGSYRYVWHHEDGRDIGMGGEYREILRPERLVVTELFDQDWTGGEAIGTTVLTEKNGRTTLRNTMLYSSKEARDGVLETPMEDGVAAGYDRLDDVLASLPQQQTA